MVGGSFEDTQDPTFLFPGRCHHGATMPPVVPRCHQAAPGARAQHLTARDVHLSLSTMAPGPPWLVMFFIAKKTNYFNSVTGL